MVADWVAEKTEQTIYGPYTAIGWVDDSGTLKGGAVFHNYTSANVHVTIYGPGAFTRKSLQDGFRYVFEYLGAVRLTAITKQTNKRMLSILKNPVFGFQYEATMKNWFGKDNDGVMFYIDCRSANRWM